MARTAKLVCCVLALVWCNIGNCRIIDSVERSDIEEAAEEALTRGDDNSVAVCVANGAGIGDMSGVQFYEYYGSREDSLDSQVQTGQTTVILHDNDSNLVGSAGLISYDIFGTDYKVVVAYYTPFNDLLYDNQYNMKVYEKGVTNNEDIFKHMLSDSAAWFYASRAEEEAVLRSEYGIDLYATMDDRNKAKMMVGVDSMGYNPYAGPDLNYGCDNLWNTCWRECDANFPGWQWTTEKCQCDCDCANPNELEPDSECEIDGPW